MSFRVMSLRLLSFGLSCSEFCQCTKKVSVCNSAESDLICLDVVGCGAVSRQVLTEKNLLWFYKIIELCTLNSVKNGLFKFNFRRVGHRVLFRSERIVLFRSFKARNVL